MERRLVQRSLQDDDFRRMLLEDPKAAVEQELGTRLPEDVRVVAVEETAQTIYLVLPSASCARRRRRALRPGARGGGRRLGRTNRGVDLHCPPDSLRSGMRLNGVKWPTKEALLRSAGSLEYGLSFMFLPPVVLTGPTRPGYLPLLGAYKRSYSPKCVEYKFCELRLYGVLRSSSRLLSKIASWVWRSVLRHFATIDNNCTTGRDFNDRGIDLCRRPNRVDVAALETLGDDGRSKGLFRVVSF